MKKSKISAIAMGLVLMCGSVFADTQTANMNVTATIHSGCDLQAEDLNLGTIVLTSVAHATADILVTCPSNTVGYIRLNEGLHNLSTQRRLLQTIGQTDYLIDYNLYSDSGYSVPFTALSAPGTGGVTFNGVGELQRITVYGEIPTQTSKPNGYYTDVVQVILDY